MHSEFISDCRVYRYAMESVCMDLIAGNRNERGNHVVNPLAGRRAIFLLLFDRGQFLSGR